MSSVEAVCRELDELVLKASDIIDSIIALRDSMQKHIRNVSWPVDTVVVPINEELTIQQGHFALAQARYASGHSHIGPLHYDNNMAASYTVAMFVSLSVTLTFRLRCFVL